MPKLILTGTDDANVPTKNSSIIAEKIPGSWLVQTKDTGHQITAQYPGLINKILQTFLCVTAKTTKISNDEPNHEKSAVWGRPGLPHQLKTTGSENEIEKECLKGER